MAQIVTLVRKTKEIFSRVKNGAYCDTRIKNTLFIMTAKKILLPMDAPVEISITKRTN